MVTLQWKEKAVSREMAFQNAGAFWRHDGNPQRPYARLTSGLISNGYFNGNIAGEEALLLGYMADELAEEYLVGGGQMPDRLVGPALGAIPLLSLVALSLARKANRKVNFSFAEKNDDGSFTFKRNPPLDGETILTVEDTMTTFGSVVRVHQAVFAKAPNAMLLPFVLGLCNRTGRHKMDGFSLITAVNASFETWEEGSNPFTQGAELVPPVEKPKEQWELLTKPY